MRWIIFILLCIIWGSSFILMKWSRDGLSSGQIASLRIFSAGMVLLPFALFHISRIPIRKLPLIILCAVLGNLIPAYLFAAAIERNIDSSLAGILNSLTPICVVVIGMLFFKAKPAKWKIIGVLVGFAGLCLLSFAKGGIRFENLGYASWIIAGTILYGINVNLVSFRLTEVRPFHLTSVSLAFMIIPTLIALWRQDFAGLDFDEPVVRWSILASIMLGVVGSAIATVLFYVLVKKAGGLFASLVTYGIPFVSIAWGYLDAEPITLLQIICLGVILTGVYLANRQQ